MINTFNFVAPNGRSFIMTSLTDTQKAFLANYTPEDDMFTTNEEALEVGTTLKLHEAENVEQLRAIRNTVVDFYDDILDAETKYDENGKYAGRTDKFYTAMTAMQSVTAVIDNFSFGKTA